MSLFLKQEDLLPLDSSGESKKKKKTTNFYLQDKGDN